MGNEEMAQERTMTSAATASQKATETKEERMERLRKKYKEMDGKIYEITTTIQEDDDEETEFDFIFRKPGVPSYERYAKLSGTSTVKQDQRWQVQSPHLEQRLQTTMYLWKNSLQYLDSYRQP